MEAQGTAQVAAKEVRSLRAELKTLQNRSKKQTAELSSAVEDARLQGSRAIKAEEEAKVAKRELEGLREAVRVAEAENEKALEETARIKKEVSDLQVDGRRVGGWSEWLASVLFLV